MNFKKCQKWPLCTSLVFLKIPACLYNSTSRSAHAAIREEINSYLTSETVGNIFSIITDPIFKPANKFLNAKLKKFKESGTSKSQTSC